MTTPIMTDEDKAFFDAYRARSANFVPNYERIPASVWNAMVASMKDGDETSGRGVDDLGD